MHNGSEETLEDVIDLYHTGGDDFTLAEEIAVSAALISASRRRRT